MQRRTLRRHGFTLVELLVVISIIALLIGILLPGLGAAREGARRTKCGAALRSVGQAVITYETTFSMFPPSYVYAAGPDTDQWVVQDQREAHPRPSDGYVHWSWALVDDASVGSEAFQCPTVQNTGAPATNPGPNEEDWEQGQVNDLGQEGPAPEPEDRQVKRCAFAANGAIMPRNKFTDTGGQRKNQLVRSHEIESPARTIAATEFFFFRDWKSLADSDGKIKSHRPIVPFVGGSTADVYREPTLGSAARFFYPGESSIYTDVAVGQNVIEDRNTQLNAIGRHHSGGAANFVFLDGHVENTTVLDTLKRRLWGQRFYSITGNNAVSELDRDGNLPGESSN